MTTKIKEKSLFVNLSEQINHSDKCGEVFVTKTGIFSCFCIVCKQSFKEIVNFTEHILTLHLGLIPSKSENVSNLEKTNNDIVLQLDIASDFLEIKMDETENMTKSTRKTEITSNNNSEPDPLDLNKLSQSEECVDLFSLETDTKLEESGDLKELSEYCESLDSNSDCNESENEKFELFPFKCDICNRSFKRNYNLLSHKKRHEKLMPSCQHCGKSFRHRSSFNMHNQFLCAQRIKRGQKLKLEQPDIKCKYCDKNFKNIACLKKHEERHEDSPFKCNFCAKKFMSQGVMQEHVRTHTGEKPYKCKYCAVAFVNATILKRHVLIHVGERTCVCTFGCGKAFYTQHERTAHERTHTGEKPFVCELCGRYFAYKHQLSLHKKRLHTDKKNWPYKCDQCDKAFIVPKQLREHMVVHTGEKPYSCDLCSGRFSKSNGLREHRKLHSDIKKHVCTICSKAFAQNAGLYSHMKSHGIIKQSIS